MAKRKKSCPPKATERIVAAKSIGNIPDCNTLEKVKERFYADAEKWEVENTTPDALSLAAGYWLGYPGFLLNVLYLYDGDHIVRHHAVLSLRQAHCKATEFLMAAAEHAGIDSGPLWESAQTCRQHRSPCSQSKRLRGTMAPEHQNGVSQLVHCVRREALAVSHRRVRSLLSPMPLASVTGQSSSD